MALSKIDRHPSAPPAPYTRSMTPTRPTTEPSASHTGRVRNLLSCMICKASSTVVSGVTDSGLGVITELTAVSSRGNSFAIALDIISLKPKMPTTSSSSTTRAALRASVITSPVSRRFVPGLTTVAGLPARRLRRVGDDLPPKACAMMPPSSCVIISA